MKLRSLLLLLSFLAAPACKQGEGEICQIDSDCKDNLVCNAATGRCQARGQVGPDAGTPPDGGADAGVDAPKDAGADAS